MFSCSLYLRRNGYLKFLDLCPLMTFYSDWVKLIAVTCPRNCVSASRVSLGMDFPSGTGRRAVVALGLGEIVPVLYVFLVYCVVSWSLWLVDCMPCW